MAGKSSSFVLFQELRDVVSPPFLSWFADAALKLPITLIGLGVIETDFLSLSLLDKPVSPWTAIPFSFWIVVCYDCCWRAILEARLDLF